MLAILVGQSMWSIKISMRRVLVGCPRLTSWCLNSNKNNNKNKLVAVAAGKKKDVSNRFFLERKGEKIYIKTYYVFAGKK